MKSGVRGHPSGPENRVSQVLLKWSSPTQVRGSPFRSRASGLTGPPQVTFPPHRAWPTASVNSRYYFNLWYYFQITSPTHWFLCRTKLSLDIAFRCKCNWIKVTYKAVSVCTNNYQVPLAMGRAREGGWTESKLGDKWDFFMDTESHFSFPILFCSHL